jgi:preprotein translocase subunit SecY
MPYISASIIMQLMGYVLPAFEQLKKEGEAGRRKITQYTRYGTLGPGFVSVFGYCCGLGKFGWVGDRAWLWIPHDCRCDVDSRNDVSDVAG